MSRGVLSRGFCPGGFVQGGFVRGGFVRGGFVRGGLSGGVLSGGGGFVRGVLSGGGVCTGSFVRGVLSGGFCPGGFCPGWFCPGGGGLSRGVLSPGVLVGGFCPGGFCLGGFCPRIERIILRHVQLFCFPSEVTFLVASKSVAKSRVLHKLSPMFNEDRLLVVQGRLTHSPVGVDHRFLIVVPHKHPIAFLIVSDIHGSAHLGQEWVVSIVSNRLWITNMRRVVKRVARDCIGCKKRFAAPGCQRMADLPSALCYSV